MNVNWMQNMKQNNNYMKKGYKMNYSLMTEQEQMTTTNFPNVNQEIEKTRALQEVQGAIIMARQFPRDEIIVQKKLKQVSKNMKFAEKAIYAYPRGGSMITGLSIRAAETLSRYWGNISCGTKTLSQNQNDHTSEIMSYCWDLETNVRSERIFKSSHIRETKNGNKILTSSRDIYEKEANDSSRRLRACILAVIPNYIVEEFMDDCESTLVGTSGKTLKQRTEELLSKFEEIGISKEIIEKKMAVTVDKFVAKNIVMLGYIYNSIKDGFAPASQFFDIPTAAQKQVQSSLEKIRGNEQTSGEMEISPELEEMANEYFEQETN